MISRLVFSFLGGAMVSALLLLSAISTASAGDLRRFVEMYRCPIVERLEIIDLASQPGDRNRFISVGIAGAVQSYVQCLFLDDSGQLLCEAASGYYALPETETRTHFLPAAAVSNLSDLGFATNSEVGNYQLTLAVDERRDFVDVAELLLSALYFGYGAQPGMLLEINAPLAPELTPEISECTPVG